jgi:hypothetical protein
VRDRDWVSDRTCQDEREKRGRNNPCFNIR